MDDPKAKPKPMLFRNSLVIQAAIRAIVGNGQGPGIPTAHMPTSSMIDPPQIWPPRGGVYQPQPKLVGQESGECVVPKSMGSAIKERAGEKLTDLQLFGVPPGHEHEPAPKKFNIIGGCCYVREEDLPKLKEALERQRAKQAAATEKDGGAAVHKDAPEAERASGRTTQTNQMQAKHDAARDGGE